MKDDENPQPPKPKKQLTFAKRFRKFKRRVFKFFTDAQNIKAFLFIFQALFIYTAFVALGLVTAFFFFQSFLFFILSLVAVTLLYISNIAVVIAHYKTIVEIISFTYRSRKDPEEQPTGCWHSLTEHACCKYLKLVLIIFLSAVLLDIPVLFYLIHKQLGDVDKQIKDEENNEKNVKKLVGKITDKEKQDKEIENKRKEIFTKIQELKALKKDRSFIIPYKLGFFALVGFIPNVFTLSVWFIDNQHQIDVYPYQNYVLYGSCISILIGSVIGLYEIQFFDKSQSKVLDALKWFFLRLLELITKSLLVGYFLKFSLYEELPLLIIGATYAIYTIGATFLFTLFDYEKQVDDEPQTKGCCHVLANYGKSLLLNIYSRTLYLPYKETPLGMNSLSFYQITLTEEKKMKREEVAPDTWKNLMVTYDITSKLGVTRRAYTHVIHSLRFFELFHLALFSICRNVLHGQYMELVESKKFSIYYQGKIFTIASIAILLIYYLRAANRTIHEKHLDISGIDE